MVISFDIVQCENKNIYDIKIEKREDGRSF